jgi:hypothetical protein
VITNRALDTHETHAQHPHQRWTPLRATDHPNCPLCLERYVRDVLTEHTIVSTNTVFAGLMRAGVERAGDDAWLS